MKVDFVASKRHYAEHLLPVWWALDASERGSFFVPPHMDSWLRFQRVFTSETDRIRHDVLVGASWPDVKGSWHGKKVLLEHGVGQTYHESNFNPHYAGGIGRGEVDLFLAPNERVLQINQKATPRSEHALVGTPKMDPWFSMDWPVNRLVTAVSFHWRCRLCAETESGFDQFKLGVLELTRLPDPLIGHAHPTLWNEARQWYSQNGIRAVGQFSQVLSSAFVYVVDNSSTLYEFAAMDRPVVVLNPPQYRRTVNHGLRFWEYADVGVQCDDPNDLVRSVEMAREDPESIRERRNEITAELYPIRDGSSAKLAAEAIRQLVVV